ncbi:N-acetyltransferase, partial [Ruegeria sp. NA]|nr:N-acetyltransferase [Ruegeria sp. NA]
MDFYTDQTPDPSETARFFAEVFSASEGPDEGAVIEAFVEEMIDTTPPQDLMVCTARSDQVLLGCAIFSRMLFPQDARRVFILSPMAVRTDRQKAGVGQALIA